MDKLIQIDKSTVHGKGLFACSDIPRGTRIADYIGIEMTLREYREKYGMDTRYTYSLRRMNKIIDGRGYENPSHYCNESLTPNVCLMRRGLYTLRDVRKDEELFLQYPKNYPRDYVLLS